MAADNTKHIITSLVVNFIIAVSKGVAAAMTGSGALLAETIHSFADCGNQGLLLFGVRQARKPPDASHPLGYGRAVYFWSFMVALLLFSGGGVFSIYEGIHKTIHPEPVGSITVGVVILGIALGLEGYSTYGNLVEFNQRRGKTGLFRYLQRTKDSDLVVIFGENSAAVVGLLFALFALIMSKATNDGRWDGIGSLVIGLVLVAVAIFLADPELEEKLRAVAEINPDVVSVLRCLTIQQGPGEILVALKIRVRPGLVTGEGEGTLCDIINKFEVEVKAAIPEIKWLFTEPDSRD
jgi:cation diffusion facilitator family transporter